MTAMFLKHLYAENIVLNMLFKHNLEREREKTLLA